LVPIMMGENIGVSPWAWPSAADGAGGIEGGLEGGGNGGRGWSLTFDNGAQGFWLEGRTAAAATFWSTHSARAGQVVAQAWLTHVLGTIADHKIIRLDELLPWHYAQ
jgi:hypothetical protein